MYNGVGLPSARGSGTSGYIQSNKGFRKPSQIKRITSVEIKRPEIIPEKAKVVNKEILEHNEKREMESKVLEYRIELEEKG